MKNKNEMYQKNNTCAEIATSVIVPALVTAQIVGCSVSTVKKVRSGFVGKTGRGVKCQQIVLADALLLQAIRMGVAQVTEILNNSKK